MARFCPANMDGKQISLEAAYKSKVPTLTYLDLCFGDGSSTIWLVLWISRVFASCGFMKGQVTDQMKIDTANVIKQEYYFLNLNELVIFFKQFVAGKYNVFYGNPNPQVITSSLNLFLEPRNVVVGKIEHEREQEKLLELETGNEMSYEDWLEIKKERGEDVYMEALKDSNGSYSYKPKKDEKLESAKMIVKNTSDCDFGTLCQLRDCFIEKYKEDPFEYYKKKKIDEKARNYKSHS